MFYKLDCCVGDTLCDFCAHHNKADCHNLQSYQISPKKISYIRYFVYFAVGATMRVTGRTVSGTALAWNLEADGSTEASGRKASKVSIAICRRLNRRPNLECLNMQKVFK